MDSAELVRSLVEQWYAEVLPGGRLDRDLFAQGGDSLALVRLVARAQQTLAVELPVEEFFRNPTGEVLAELVLDALEVAGVPHQGATGAR